MKRQFSIILLFFLCFHFIIPWLYFMMYGFVNLYSTVQGYTGMIVNLIAIIGTVCVIRLLPPAKKVTIPSLNHVSSFFFIAILIIVYKFISGGGYLGALSGNNHGTWISFLSLFFNVNIAFFLMMCLQKDIKHVYFLICIYVILMTSTGSRSAVIGVLFVIFYLPLFYNNNFVGHKIKRILIVLAIISPMIFLYGTSVRGYIDRELLGKIIVGRISFVELSMIPLQGRSDGSMDEVIFDEKYSFSNQAKQVVNVLSPVDPFEYDIAPNQYFRQIFFGASEKSVLDSYMSINLTLPVYFVMRTNYVVGIILTILFLVGLYWLWVRFASNQYVFFSILFSLYNILYFFDWVMIAQEIFTICLTVFALRHYELFLNSVVYTYKKYVGHTGLLKKTDYEESV